MTQAKPKKTYKGRFVETIQLTLVSDPDFWVEVRTRLNAGDREAANNELYQVVAEARKEDDQKGRAGAAPAGPQQMSVMVKPNMAAYQRQMVQASLVDWNLTDVDGTKLPLAWQELDDVDLDMIYKFVDESNKGKTVADQERFPE